MDLPELTIQTSEGTEVLWVRRTAGGRDEICWKGPCDDGFEVTVSYDGTPVVCRVFSADDEEAASIWAESQRTARTREVEGRRCPQCDRRVTRSHTAGIERLVKWLSAKRPYRCPNCRWRGWLGPDPRNDLT